MTKTLNLLKKYWFEIAIALIILLSLGYSLFFGTVRVSGSSMEPSYSHGDLLIMHDTNRNVKRGDVVRVNGAALTERVGTREWNNMIKRVVALPGDTVEMNDNTLYINGAVESVSFEMAEMTNNADFVIELEADEYYLLGDNRNFSGDSRDFGPAHRDEISGSVFFTLYSAR